MAVVALAVATDGLVGLGGALRSRAIAVLGLISHTTPVLQVQPVPPGSPVIVEKFSGGRGSGPPLTAVIDEGQGFQTEMIFDLTDELAAEIVGALSPLRHAEIAAAIVLAAKLRPKR